MTGPAFERVITELERRGHRVRRHGQYAKTTCTHDGADNPEGLSIFDNGSRVRLTCFTRGCQSDEIAETLGLTWRDLYDQPHGDDLAVYRYDDGRTVHRKPGKQFRQTGTSHTPTLYHASRLAAAVQRGDPIYLVEGEEDVHTLEAVGCTATTAPMGARNFDKVDVAPLHGASVVAIPDNDTEGGRWAELVTRKLADISAALKFAHPVHGKDTSDHIAAGGTVETLRFDPTPEQLLHDRQVNEELRKMRVRNEARQILANEQTGPLPPFDAGNLTDILARPASPPSRVQDLIPWNAGTLLTAQRKTGKTTMVLNLARALITGEDFLDQYPVRQIGGRVAILNYEVSGNQLAWWAAEHHIKGDQLYLVNLRGRRNPLRWEDDRQQLCQLLIGHEIETLIVDPFGRAYTGLSQNDAGEVGAFLNDLDRFARTEVGALDLILTAHAGWNGERTRGSTALEDWADSIITLTRDETEDGHGERYMRAIGRDVEVEEDQLLYDAETRTLRMAGAGSRRVAGVNRHAGELRAAILTIVAGHPGAKGGEVEVQLRDNGVVFQKGQERKMLAELVAAGDLSVVEGLRGAKLYSVTPPSPSLPKPPHGEPGDPPHQDPPFKGGPGEGRPIDLGTVPILDAAGEGRTCRVCQQVMTVVESGQTTHPGCDTTINGHPRTKDQQ